MANLQPNAQKKILIAEYCGKPAGIAMMRFDNVKESSPGDDDLPYCSVLGCCNVLRLSRNYCWKPTVPDRHLLLDVLAIMDGFRGKGIGKTLLVAVDKCAKDAGLQAVCLWCAYENPALRLYLRHGYIEDQFITGHWRANCATGVSFSFYKDIKEVASNKDDGDYQYSLDNLEV